jgi:saccharopine dehydrogenase-like NADP-dependent oxidoreductase
MEGIDFRSLFTIGGLVATVATSFAVVRTQLAGAMKEIAKLATALDHALKRMETAAKTADREASGQAVLAQRLDTVVSILSPANLAARTHSMAVLETRIDFALEEIRALRARHSGANP